MAEGMSSEAAPEFHESRAGKSSSHGGLPSSDDKPTTNSPERSGRSDAIVMDGERPPASSPNSAERAGGGTSAGEAAPTEFRGTGLDTAKLESSPGEQQIPPSSTGSESAAPPNAVEKESTGPAKGAEITEPTSENPELLTNLPPVKRSFFGRASSRIAKDDELKRKIVIPHYLSKGMVDAVQSGGAVSDSSPQVSGVTVPENPILVFINAKSGGRLGPQLETMLVDLIAPTQVYDLSKCKPVDVFRHALGHLEKEADNGDKVALATRNNLRVLIAGGDGTVGWVIGAISEAGGQERFTVPPVAVIPLGTGNDLSRSFRWGGATTSISRKAVRRCLAKAIEAEVMHLDRWQVVVRPAPTRKDAPLKLPHAMRPQHPIPLELVGSGKHEGDDSERFEGPFWNYFSLGMDAQVAYGFHTFRDESPWLASGRVANQLVYGGYSCFQGWFCTPCAAYPVARGLRQIAKLKVKRPIEAVDTPWEELVLPQNIRAIVILNLQSYAGGRNPWGRPSSRSREKKGYQDAKSDDGLLEIVGFRDGWHTTVVLLDLHTAVRLGQATAVRLELTGTPKRQDAYMQMDGEPWQQPLGGPTDAPAVVEITCHPMQSRCLLRK